MNYLTVAEYKASPSAVDTSSLVSGGSADQQTAELYRRIGVASAWIDNFCNQPLGAAARTTTQMAPMDRWGNLRLHPGPWPLVSLTSLSTGLAANSLVAVADLTGVYIIEQDFIVPTFGGGAATLIGGIQLGWPPARTGRILSRYTFVSGYPVTTLAADCIASATSLQVTSSVGFVVGQAFEIVDGATTETVTVTAVPDATHLTVSATAYAHTHGTTRATEVGVHAMPYDIKEACRLITTAFVRSRGNDAPVMSSSMAPAPTQTMSPVASNDLRMAREILAGYRSVY